MSKSLYVMTIRSLWVSLSDGQRSQNDHSTGLFCTILDNNEQQ